MTGSPDAIRAQAHLHHAWLLGLQLSVAVHEGAGATGEWMFRLFRRQHEAKFLASFGKLGLEGLPNAVACARYHVLSNDVGGVGVEYAEESERKAWVRFRYPRWMYAGPTICGVPVETSRGFLRGWYAHNGVSLGDPHLRFVCVSEDMTGQFGLCGYFEETEADLGEDERLHFAPDERPPDFSRHEAPALPETDWSPERREKARRNYALEYLRNGLPELAAVIGEDRAREHGRRTARLIGLQYQAELATMVGAEDGDADDAATLLARLLEGMGDAAVVSASGAARIVEHTGLRVVRDLPAADADRLLDAWVELYRGMLAAQHRRRDVEVERTGEGLRWTITPAPTAP